MKKNKHILILLLLITQLFYPQNNPIPEDEYSSIFIFRGLYKSEYPAHIELFKKDKFIGSFSILDNPIVLYIKETGSYTINVKNSISSRKDKRVLQFMVYNGNTHYFKINAQVALPEYVKIVKINSDKANKILKRNDRRDIITREYWLD